RTNEDTYLIAELLTIASTFDIRFDVLQPVRLIACRGTALRSHGVGFIVVLEYISSPSISSLMLLRQAVLRAASRAWAKTGKRMAASIAIIAITTSSSISVKLRLKDRYIAVVPFSAGMAAGLGKWQTHSDSAIIGQRSCICVGRELE